MRPEPHLRAVELRPAHDPRGTEQGGHADVGVKPGCDAWHTRKHRNGDPERHLQRDPSTKKSRVVRRASQQRVMEPTIRDLSGYALITECYRVKTKGCRPERTRDHQTHDQAGQERGSRARGR